MYWRYEYEREGAGLTLGQTYQLDLPENGLLGSLLLCFSGAQATGQGQGGGAWRLIDYISKIEILLDGATICKSLTGKQAQALSVFDQWHMPPGSWRNYATNTQYEYVLINFGRWLKDHQFGLDLARFKNVEINIENTGAAGTWGNITVSIMKVILSDAPSSQFLGFLRTEQWRSWVTAAGETKYLDIPTEHILRRLMLQAIPAVDASFVEKTGMHNLMDDLECMLDTGEVRVYKGGIDDLMRINAYDLGGSLLSTGFHYMTADKGVDVGLGYVEGGAWGAGSNDNAAAAVIPTMEAGRTSFTQKPETYEADSPMGFIFRGIAPFCCAMLRFDDDPDPTTWLDTARRQTVELNIHTRDHADAVGGANAVVLDRLVRY